MVKPVYLRLPKSHRRAIILFIPNLPYPQYGYIYSWPAGYTCKFLVVICSLSFYLFLQSWLAFYVSLQSLLTCVWQIGLHFVCVSSLHTFCSSYLRKGGGRVRWVAKVSTDMLTCTYPHKPICKVVICNHQADSLFYIWPDV